ncbi:MAG TPA: glycosyltransferase [Candidatus Acidoferrales bacterium]|nr:glycosyltransferase [Candidatus Acidoferrales bacterium]
MRRIEFVYFDAGGGHRSAATALKSVIDTQDRGWDVQLFNFQEQLDALDFVRTLTRVRMQDVYNLMLRRGWTLGSTQLMRVLQATIRLYHPLLVRRLADYWRSTRPDMVVSFIPHFNRALAESFRKAFPGRPFVTLLTDIADYPPHFWIERQEQFLICGSERAVEQAREAGHSLQRIFRTSGMILNPRFYTPVTIDLVEARKRLGLEPKLLTGLVLFGGYGARAMLEIAERLEGSELPLQLIFICGKNERLAKQLRSRPQRQPRFVEGFTREVPYYMKLSDFFLGKPGPGSISEALAMRLPVIVERNTRTLPQERYNAQWVRENNYGLTVQSWREAVPATRALIDPEQLAARRQRIAALENRAVFEIPDVLQRILDSPAGVG